MATKVKKAIINDVENSIAELEDVTQEDIDELFDYTPIQVDKIPDPMVEVIPLRDFRCNYAGVQYFFNTNKKQRVPIAVRDFLLQNTQNPKIKNLW